MSCGLIVLGLFGVQWVRLRRGLDMLASWQGQFSCHWNKDIWKVVPHCLMRCLWWQERNARSFEGCEWSILDLKLYWTLALRSFSFTSLVDPFDNCTWDLDCYVPIVYPVYMGYFFIDKIMLLIKKMNKISTSNFCFFIDVYNSEPDRIKPMSLPSTP